MYNEGENFREMMEGFQIENLGQLDRLGANDMWDRYKRSQVNMEVTQLEMEEMTICFRLYRSITLAFNASFHFYDEIHQHLLQPEDFISYFEKNEALLLKTRWHY